MTDSLSEGNYDVGIDPVDLQNTLIGFLGQTYQEVSRYDANLVQSNQTLTPKKEEFHRVAEKVMQEARQSIGPSPHPQIIQPQQNNRQQVVVQTHVNTHQQSAPVDQNQMEFSFDNSITAITINNRLDDIEKRIKRLDSTLEKVISLLDHHESKNKK